VAARTKRLYADPKISWDYEQELARWRLETGKAEAYGAPVPYPPTMPNDRIRRHATKIE
jgi:hypothetical protein